MRELMDYMIGKDLRQDWEKMTMAERMRLMTGVLLFLCGMLMGGSARMDFATAVTALVMAASAVMLLKSVKLND